MDNAFNLVDHQINVVAATALSLQGGPTDITQYFNTSAAAPINQKLADEVELITDPITPFVDTPQNAADAGINLPITGATSSSVKLALDTDRYAKPPVDRLATLNTRSLQALGRALGKGLIKEGNARALRAAVTEGTAVALSGTTAQSNWSQLNAQAGALAEDGYSMSDFVLLIAATELARFTDDVKVLSGSGDPRERVGAFLGGVRVVVANPGSFTTGTGETAVTTNGVAVLAHSGALAVAKRLDEVRFREGDASDYAIARIKTGAKVLEEGAVTVFTRA